MFSTLPTTNLCLSFLSVLVMAAACFAVGFRTANQAARHPVPVAGVLGRSGRVHLGIMVAGVLGVLIALIAEHGLPKEPAHQEADSE